MLAPRPLASPFRLSHFIPISHQPIPLVSGPRFRSTATSTFRSRPSRFGTLRCSFGNGGRGGGDDKGSGGGYGSGGGDEGFGGYGSFLSWHMKVLAMNPLLTNSVTSAFLNLAGDIFCQLFIDRVSVLDFRRLSVFAFLGLALVGPTLLFWFRYLIQVVTLQGSFGTILRLFIEQFLFSPVFIGAYICLLVALEGRSSEVVPTLQQE